MKQKPEDESAVALAAAAEEPAAEGGEKKQKQSLLKTITGAVETAKSVGNFATEVYSVWIKPIHDNWSQIKRRMSMISTIISLIFFALYVPFLLIGRIGKDLALGYDVALYVCIGVYLFTLAALLIVTLASGKTNTVAMEKKRKMISRIILMVVRFASLAIGITALVISAVEGATDSHSAAVDTVAIIFAVMSIIFSAFPLLFGGMGGFFKWLISPAKIKFRFSFVALEWFQAFTDEQQLDKNIKKVAKKYGERVSACIDGYILPALGAKLIKTVDAAAINKMLSQVPEADLNMCGWIIKQVFEYAEDCNYIEVNPCERLDLQCDIATEAKVRKAENQKRGFFSLFKRKGKEEKPAAEDGEEQ